MYIQATYELSIDEFGKVLLNQTFDLRQDYTEEANQEKRLQHILTSIYDGKATLNTIVRVDENPDNIEDTTYTILERFERNTPKNELYSLQVDWDEATFVPIVHRNFNQTILAALDIIIGKRDEYGLIYLYKWVDGECTGRIRIGETHI